MKRCSGVLFPISALPSRFGIGDFGKEGYELVDLIKEGGFQLWQILPLNPLGYGHSPYQPFSSFALDELYLDLDDLFAKGLLKKKAPSFNAESAKVAYEDIRNFKEPYFKEAFKTYLHKDPQGLDEFIVSHPWAKNWSIFMSLKRSENLVSWDHWPSEKQTMLSHLETLTPEQKEAAQYEIFLQKFLYEEWDKLHDYANKKGIRIIGDLPFYVGHDSVDVYEDQDDFLLDPNTKQPAWIAGVPPDYFSATGQRWGNPIYNWDRLKTHQYDFIINRIKRNAGVYDILRLDHFRAFDTYWKIPASCPTAVEGSWILGPSYDFFDTLFKKAPNIDIIAEDLGDLRPEVLTLRDHYNFPGMNVVEFTFNDAAIMKKPDMDKENMVAYLGTHDNDPLLGFYSKLTPEEQNQWTETLKELGYADGSINDKFIAYEMNLKANYAIFAMQDLLGLGSEARINVPGVIDDINWTWKLVNFEALKAKLPTLLSLNKQAKRI
jgi:4-alpha-glucanotransferase